VPALAFEHELLGRARREVGDDTVDRGSPTGDRDPICPVGTERRVDTPARAPRAPAPARRSSCRRPRRCRRSARSSPDVPGCAREERRGRRQAEVPDARVVLRAPARRTRRRREHRVQAADDLEPRAQAPAESPPGIFGNRPPAGAMRPKERGPGAKRRAVLERRHRSARRCAGTQHVANGSPGQIGDGRRKTRCPVEYAITPCAIARAR